MVRLFLSRAVGLTEQRCRLGNRRRRDCVRRIHTGIINNSDDVRAKILQFASMAPHPVSLQDILRASSEPRQDGAAFLHEEFSIRCAERILMMEESIPGWEAIPELSEAHSLHMNSFAAVQNIHLDDSDSLDDFTTVARSIVENTRDMVKLMCKGMCVLVRSDEQQDINEAFVNKFLNEFLLNRIGSNVLMSQYLSICGDTPTSIVDPHCDVTDICRKTSRAVQALCAQETGFHPNIRVEAHSSGNSDTATFAFIPAALSYILQELLKNSSVATSKAVSSSHSDRPISVVVCYDDRRVMICIGDRAGGIPFDVGQHVWSYLYTTKKRDDSDDLEKSGATELTGFGVGLPLSRLYASYLGGSLNLVSLPGYGTHAYVFLPRLPQELVEIVPRRDYGCDLSKSGGEFIL